MATVPYDTIALILQATRERCNDVIQSLGGNTLTDIADFTPIYVNTAWRVLQNKLRALGYTGFARLKEDLIVSAIPISASSDTAVQNYITWAGFYNGSTTNGTVVLPQEFMQPLVLWERPNQAANSLSSAQNFRLMDQCLNGIPTNGPKQSRNINWEWINDQIRFPGTTVVWDLRVRCLTYLPDFPAPAGVLTTTTPVPILDCLDPFSNLIAVEFSRARGDLDTATFAAAADAGIAAMYSRDTAQPSAYRKASEYGPMRNQYTPGQSAPLIAPPAQGGGQ